MERSLDEFLSGRVVAVTGATGFIGRRLVDLVRRHGGRCVALVRPGAGPVDADVVLPVGLNDPDGLGEALGSRGASVLFHLAAQSRAAVDAAAMVPTLEANVAGTWNVLDAARSVGGFDAVVTASSDRVYGRHGSAPIGEEAPLLATRPYEVSKLCADVVARSFTHQGSLRVAVARLSNVFGPGDVNWPRIVPGTFREVLSDRPPVVHSDGSARRDYLFVDDAVDALGLLAAALASDAELTGRAVNIASGEARSVLDVVDLVQAAAGTSYAPRIEGERTGPVDNHAVRIDLARELLGWTPTTPIQEALARTADWYRAHLGSGQP